MEKSDKKIGEKRDSLKPAKVKIVSSELLDVKTPEGNKSKVIFSVLHPDAKSEIKISKVRYEKKGKIETSGTWYIEDKDGNIPYNSALANLMRFFNAETLKDLIGEEASTMEDENGFLIFKAY